MLDDMAMRGMREATQRDYPVRTELHCVPQAAAGHGDT
jgi:hypothetical protein